MLSQVATAVEARLTATRDSTTTALTGRETISGNSTTIAGRRTRRRLLLVVVSRQTHRLPLVAAGKKRRSRKINLGAVMKTRTAAHRSPLASTRRIRPIPILERAQGRRKEKPRRTKTATRTMLIRRTKATISASYRIGMMITGVARWDQAPASV